MLIVLIDPIFRYFCCGRSPFSFFSSVRKQNKILEKAEEKFTDELDVKNMIAKIRDSYDLVNKLVNKEYKGLLKYHKSRTICVDSCSGSDS